MMKRDTPPFLKRTSHLVLMMSSLDVGSLLLMEYDGEQAGAGNTLEALSLWTTSDRS